MNTAKKIMASALLALATLGLFTSLPALADGASDAALYCVGCHDGIYVNGVAIGGGAKICPQRTVTEWTATIDRMNGKGCGVPAGSIAGIASYLADLGTTTTTTRIEHIRCYNADGTIFVYYYGSSCPPGSTSYPPTTSSTTTTSTEVTATSTSTAPVTTTTTTTTTNCPHYALTFTPYSLSFTATQGGALPASQSLTLNFSGGFFAWSITSTPSWLSVTSGSVPGTLTVSIPSTQIDAGSYTGTINFRIWEGSCGAPSPYVPVNFTVEPAVTTTTSTMTVATTTTTTLCNTYVNGTTQYPYSGSGSCHGHSDDGTTTGHVVRDQKWCRKHMTHFNSGGNHTHAYPHPACM